MPRLSQQQATSPPVRASHGPADQDHRLHPACSAPTVRAWMRRGRSARRSSCIITAMAAAAGRQSWGSRAPSRRTSAMATGSREIRWTVGCGALGLTSATLLQRAGYPVTIYALGNDRSSVRSCSSHGQRAMDAGSCVFARGARATPESRQLWRDDARHVLRRLSELSRPCRASWSNWIDFYRLAGGPLSGRRRRRRATRSSSPNCRTTCRGSASGGRQS